MIYKVRKIQLSMVNNRIILNSNFSGRHSEPVRHWKRCSETHLPSFSRRLPSGARAPPPHQPISGICALPPTRVSVRTQLWLSMWKLETIDRKTRRLPTYRSRTATAGGCDPSPRGIGMTGRPAGPTILRASHGSLTVMACRRSGPSASMPPIRLRCNQTCCRAV